MRRPASAGSAPGERQHALHEGLLGAGGEQQHAEARDGLSRRRRASPGSVATPVRLSLAPGRRAGADVGDGRGRGEGKHRAGDAQRARGAASAPARDKQRAADDRPHQRRRRVGALDEAREAVADAARGGWKSSRVRGVVVGGDHEGVLGVRIAGLARRRSRSGAGQQARGGTTAPAADVVADRGRGEGAARRARGGRDARVSPAAPAIASSRPSGHQ